MEGGPWVGLGTEGSGRLTSELRCGQRAWTLRGVGTGAAVSPQRHTALSGRRTGMLGMVLSSLGWGCHCLIPRGQGWVCGPHPASGEGRQGRREAWPPDQPRDLSATLSPALCLLLAGRFHFHFEMQKK